MGIRSAPLLRLVLAALAAAASLVTLPSAAGARGVFVTNFGFTARPPVIPGSLSIIDSRTNEAGPQIELGTHPGAIAIAPDGRTAYVVNGEPGNVIAVDLQSMRQVGPPILVGRALLDVAISPDGSQAYVTDFEGGRVFVIDTATNHLVGGPIQVGKGAETVAFAPDGAHAYVTNAESKSVSVIDTARRVATATIPVGRRPEGIAPTPDGSKLYVANDDDGTVSVIDARTDATIGLPIEVGVGPTWVAVSPDGSRAYVSNFSSESVTVIDTRSDEVLTTVSTGEEPIGIAVSPDSRTWYLVTLGDQRVTAMDAASEKPLSGPITVGTQPGRAVFVPDQPPLASFSTAAVVRPGAPAAFDGSASRDPDGSIARFAWDFGDGAVAADGGPTPVHAFSRPGEYTVRATLTDDEGCSTRLVFTGQTASCNGSEVATTTRAVSVAYPAVRVHCPARAGGRGCAFRLQALTRRRKGRAESAVARAKLKAGASALVTLKPRARFAGNLPPGGSVLVRRTARIGTSHRTGFARLEIVR